MKPTLIAEILKKFPTGLPSDTAIQDFLLRDKNFNPASVEFFVKVLRKTIKFARLDNPADSQFVQSGESDIGYLEEAKRTDMPSGQHRSSVAPQPVIEGVEIPYFSFTLKGITVEFRASGPLQREHLELIRAHLDAYASPSSSKSD